MLVLLLTWLACAPLPAEAPPTPGADEAGARPHDPVAAQIDRTERTGIARPDRAAARHILIAWTGGPTRPRQDRNAAQARELARQLHQELRAGASFAALARRWSDDSTARRGGDLGAFDKGQMVEPFERAVFALDPDFGLSEPVESPYGVHIIQRYPLEEIHLLHILVAVGGEEGGGRSEEEAQARAAEATARLLAGEAPAAVARDLSDGPAGLRGGDVGWFQRGELRPELDEGAFALRPGQVSPPLRSERGLHLFVRLE